MATVYEIIVTIRTVLEFLECTGVLIERSDKVRTNSS